ncbi:MAG TPA: DUF418 domain-containing protein, partial [Burkholderiales bacterium]|nr:DUF418 domain-containing protein [Burkholderiales bacterium]
RLAGEATTGSDDVLDAVVRFAIGWLATGKFVTSLSILFGIGAALIAARALREGSSPRPLLARRYVALMLFGIAHMLLYPGDILFVYGVTGMCLLPFVMLRVPALLGWSLGLFIAFNSLEVVYLLSVTTLEAAPYVDTAPAEASDDIWSEKRAATIAAFMQGAYLDIVPIHIWQALLLQSMQLPALPWILSLFLLGYAVARAGVLYDLEAHRRVLRAGALIGLGIGLPANIGVGLGGPLAGWGPTPADEPLWITQWQTLGFVLGEPLLAIGYLCALSLLFMKRGAPPRLVAVGRMTLTAYMLQSVLGLCVFLGLRLYDQLTNATALLAVIVIWCVLLVACPIWLRHFQIGPAEWLWRTLTYGRIQPLRIARN